MAYGRLSEIVGPDTVPLDSYVRKMGLSARVKHHMDTISDVERDALVAYANGVNTAYRETAFLSSEFWFTMTDFEEWKPEDAVAVWTILQ